MQRLLAVAFAAWLAAPAAGAGSTAPRLALVGRDPIVLSGRLFQPGERVRVTVEARVQRVRTVRAGVRGGFVARFPDLSVPRCGGVFARARGDGGSVAVLKIPLPACQPD